ncbi:Artemisinic aldehyde Delta(11(13)) reductase [Mycena sanguinolenta]|uniref:Artemisinic aldehyde Delta(11(13)) reductase n=1 Tax=Mycena sanguinolenta TaxID=230812 RepID=A0A8H7D7D4_9AGAR|nr:Artemisinic aldehyde Delta(11(13)) reductase [Mycena sanguinolenta]
MSSLFTPLTLGSITIPNRIGMSALTRNRSTGTVPNEIMLKYYVQRAKGGAGLIGLNGPNVLGFGIKFRSKAGGKLPTLSMKLEVKFMLSFGIVSLTLIPVFLRPIIMLAAGVPVYAPSAIAAQGGRFRLLPGEPGYVTPTEIADPTPLIAQFKQAAINAKEAGFDGVEFHGANGYLVHQFLDSTSNHRTDQWGGSPENRARFALETLKELIAVWGPDVSLKLSPAGGYNDMGMPLQDTIDTFGYLLREVDNMGLSYVALVRFDEEDDGPRGTAHDVVETFRPFLTKTALFVNSSVTPAEGEELVKSGKAAGVFMGMNWLTHPDVARRIKEGKELDNAPDFKSFYGRGRC